MDLLANARTELESLLTLRAEIDRKIEAVTKTIEILEPQYAQEHDRSRLLNLSVMMAGLAHMGITEAIQWALTTSPEGLSPIQVRDVLVEHGYPLRGQNPMATVHTVLKRLASRPNGPVVVDTHTGKALYASRERPPTT